GLVVLLAAIGIPYYIHGQAKANDDAQGVFSLAQYYQHAGVDPKNGPFKSEDEKNQQALSSFQRVVNDFAGTPTAKLARYFVAKDQLLLRQNALAYSSFDMASQELKGTPLGDEAYLGKIVALEADNKLSQATAFAESFIKNSTQSFIYPEVALNLAALYFQNQEKDKAKDQLNEIIKDYPDTNWSKEATERLADLKL
ncbi:MAG TPA: tetratricopeptide repeat protein, partial [bacterium]|nr:tetratricopeptide repeat protein [bacterium]